MTSYKDLLDAALRGLPRLSAPPDGCCRAPSGRTCTLCNASLYDEDTERRAKQTAVHEFWRERIGTTALQPLGAASPGRAYRSISKRKLFVRGREILLGLIDPAEERTGGILPVNGCAIEPASHQEVYRRVREATSSRALIPLFDALRYVIVRGDERQTLVILSVTDAQPSLVKSANALSKLLTGAPSTVRGVYLHEDESDGRYYLGSGDPAGRVSLRKLYGLQGLTHDVAGKRFFYPPPSFSQVNHGALELLTGTVATLLKPEKSATLLDLYCGYGLFGLTLAGTCKQVIGADISPESISAAQDNAQRQKAGNARFIRSTLDEAAVESLLRRTTPPLYAILDPPRGGTAAGVIPLIAGFGPVRVVHLFCNVERMPDELKAWEQGGYSVETAVPLDMFPGTAAVEIVASLTRRP